MKKINTSIDYILSMLSYLIYLPIGIIFLIVPLITLTILTSIALGISKTSRVTFRIKGF